MVKPPLSCGPVGLPGTAMGAPQGRVSPVVTPGPFCGEGSGPHSCCEEPAPAMGFTVPMRHREEAWHGATGRACCWASAPRLASAPGWSTGKQPHRELPGAEAPCVVGDVMGPALCQGPQAASPQPPPAPLPHPSKAVDAPPTSPGDAWSERCEGASRPSTLRPVQGHAGQEGLPLPGALSTFQGCPREGLWDGDGWGHLTGATR